jgi:hypothetical protein
MGQVEVLSLESEMTQKTSSVIVGFRHLLPSSGLLRRVSWFKRTFRDSHLAHLQESKLSKDGVNLEDGINRQCRNVGFKPTYGA